MSYRIAVLAVLLLLFGAGSAAPQDKHAPQESAPTLKRLRPRGEKKAADATGRQKPGAEVDEDEPVRIETSLVVCPVMVLDRQGRAVRGLTREDFLVTEDGRPQLIGTFTTGDDATVPRSIVLIMDYSGSMLPYIKTSVEAAKRLVDQLGPRDRMAVVTDDVKLLVDFTADKAELKSRLEKLKGKADSGDARRGWGSGHSLQYTALLATLREMFDEEDIRPVIIFQTDGDELNILRKSSVEEARPPKGGDAREPGLAEVFKTAERSRATVYSVIPGVRLIGLGPGEADAKLKTLGEQLARDPLLRRMSRGGPVPFEEFVNVRAGLYVQMQRTLFDLAKLTGGWADFLEDPSQADAVYTRILSDINKRYVLAYYPDDKAHDGKRRRVSIEVRGHPEYTVWGRKSYYAPDPE
jgi:VWFA-related protein